MAGTYKCNEHECQIDIAEYRQCSHCKHELGYCKPHGGEDRAFHEMVVHIQTHPLKVKK